MTFDEYKAQLLNKIKQDTKLDEGVINHLNRINSFPEVVTIVSCTGHKETAAAYLSVAFRDGRQAMEALVTTKTVEDILNSYNGINYADLSLSNFSELTGIRYGLFLRTKRMFGLQKRMNILTSAMILAITNLRHQK